ATPSRLTACSRRPSPRMPTPSRQASTTTTAPSADTTHGRSTRTVWTATTPMSFFAFPLMTNIDMIAPRPVLLVAGAEAHSRYYSEDVHAAAPDDVELIIVPGADHVDLYDKTDLIPFEALDASFTKNLA